jgi:hypothetical protein
MNNATADQLKKVQKVSTIVKGAFQGLMVLVSIGSFLKIAGLVFMPDGGATMTSAGANVVTAGQRAFNFHLSLLDMEVVADEVQLSVRVVIGIALVLSLLVYLKILKHLVALFADYEQGQIFTRANVHQLRQIGITILCIPALWLAVDLGFVVLTQLIAPGSASVESGFPVMTLLTGIIVVLMSWIMDVGRAMQEESELVI